MRRMYVVQLFSDYFNQAPKLNIPGYTFPVEEFYLEVKGIGGGNGGGERSLRERRLHVSFVCV